MVEQNGNSFIKVNPLIVPLFLKVKFSSKINHSISGRTNFKM